MAFRDGLLVTNFSNIRCDAEPSESPAFYCASHVKESACILADADLLQGEKTVRLSSPSRQDGEIDPGREIGWKTVRRHLRICAHELQPGPVGGQRWCPTKSG